MTSELALVSFDAFIANLTRKSVPLKDRNNILQVRFRDPLRNNKQVFRCIPQSENWPIVFDKNRKGREGEANLKASEDDVIRRYYKEQKVTQETYNKLPEVTIGQAMKEWFEARPEYKPKTVEQHQYCFYRFFEVLVPASIVESRKRRKVVDETPCSDITLDLYRQIAKNLTAAVNEKRMTGRYFTMCRVSAHMLMGFMKSKGYINTDFIGQDNDLMKRSKVDPKLKSQVLLKPRKRNESNKSVEVWEDEEYIKIRDFLTGTDKTEVILIRYTGMDRADFGKMNRTHVKKIGSDYQIEMLRSKMVPGTNPLIKLPLFSPAKEIILEAVKEAKTDDSLLFPWIAKTMNLNTGKGSHSYLYDKVRFAWDKVYGSSRKPKSIKAFRHTFATWCLKSRSKGGLGLPMHVVQDFLGHVKSSTMIREVYAHLVDHTDHVQDIEAIIKAQEAKATV